MRATSQVMSPAALGPGDHVCWSYESDAEYCRNLAEYIAAGVDAGDKLVCFTDGVHPDRVVAEVEHLLPGRADELLSSGRLSFFGARDAYTPDGRFDEDRMLDTFRAQAGAAVDEGYRALRAAGETAWLLDHVDAERLAAYEAQCDRMAAAFPLTGLCTYDARGRDREALAAIHAVHPASYGSSTASPPFRVYADADGSVSVAGEADTFAATTFAAAVVHALAMAERPVVDLRGLTFIDVAALRAFARVLSARSDRTPVELRGMQPVTRRCWDLLRLSQAVPGVRVA